MSVLRPRKRLVYFRVSEDEFQEFYDMCGSSGARSISDMARSALQNMIRHQDQGSAEHVCEKLVVLQGMISELNHKVAQLTLSLKQERATPNDSAESPHTVS